MRRVLPIVLLGFAVAGCGAWVASPPGPAAIAPFSPGLVPPGPPAPMAQIRARFGGLVDTIEVHAMERLPLRAAALIAPDGASSPATFIGVDAMPRIETGQWAVTHRWDDPVSQDNAVAALVLRNARGSAALHSRQQLMAVVSSAEIPLPDPVAYRRDWRSYRIRLTFGTPPANVETVVIPAPAPPAG